MTGAEFRSYAHLDEDGTVVIDGANNSKKKWNEIVQNLQVLATLIRGMFH